MVALRRSTLQGNTALRNFENRTHIGALYVARAISAASIRLQADALPGQRTASIR